MSLKVETETDSPYVFGRKSVREKLKDKFNHKFFISE
jgi:hypothetical protein